jgi:copper homeostasis protein
MRKLEVIASTPEDAVNAESGGASTLELVQNLALGGLTPSLELVQTIRDQVQIPLRVIVRPHADSFVYSEVDVAMMLNDIEALKKIGADGIVFGALNVDDTVNMELTKRIGEAVQPMELTFHRAIDVSRDADQALVALNGIAQRILTSGQADNVWDGRDTIKCWIAEHGGNFIIACGGGIRFDKLADIVRATEGPEYHVGTAAQTIGVVDSEKVRQMVEVINAA